MQTTDYRPEHQMEHCGCRLAYAICGSGPPVVLIQGAGIHGAGWLPQIDELQQFYRCLSFDNRGLGRSQPVGAPLTIPQMAEDTTALMDAQGWTSAHIVGHSMGGLIALHLALNSPSRVRSLALLCTFASGRDVTRLSLKMSWLGLRTYLGSRRMRRHAFLRMVMPPDLLKQIDLDQLASRLHPLFGHDLADHPAIVMKQLAALRVYDATSRLGELSRLPTLVVSAKHDLIARCEWGRALATHIRGARYVEFSDAAHGVTLQCPNRINALLREHLSTSENVHSARTG